MSPSVPPTGSAEELKQVELKQLLVQYLYNWSYCTATVLLRHSYRTTSAQLLYYFGTLTVLLWHS